MKLSRTRVLRAVTILTLTLAASTASAIHCIESIRPVGNPTFIPIVQEILPSAVAAKLAEFPQVLSKKPKVRRLPSDGKIATMGGETANDLVIIGTEGGRPYYRPDVQEVEGFATKVTDDPVWNTAEPYVYGKADIEIKGTQIASPPVQNSGFRPMYGARITSNSWGGDQTSSVTNAFLETIRQPTLKTESRMLVYGVPGKGMRPIALETNEVVAAHAAVDPAHHLVVTVRIDQKIGFYRDTNASQRNFLIEVYQLEEAGYAYTSFRVDADDVPFPKVEIRTNDRGALLLQVEKQYFDLDLLDLRKLGAAGG